MSVRVTRQSVTPQPNRPCSSVRATWRSMTAPNASALLKRKSGTPRDWHLHREAQPRPGSGRRDPEPDRGAVRVGVGVEHLDRAPGPAGALDVEDAGVGELRLDAVLLREGGREDLLLDAAVERHDHVPVVVAAGVDQRVLVGERRQGRPQGRALLGPDRRHRRLERGRGEVMVVGAARAAETVAHPDCPEPVQPRDLPGPGLGGADPVSGLEELDARDLADASLGQVEALAHPHRAGEDPDVGDLLPRRAALDLEHPPRRRRLRRGFGDREQVGDALHQLGNPGAGGRRAGVHRMQQSGGGLRGDLATQPARRAAAPLDVRREKGVVVLGEHLRLAVPEADVVGAGTP